MNNNCENTGKISLGNVNNNCESIKTISLNGEWSGRINTGTRGPRNISQVKNIDDMRCIPFTVPGEVHLDLMKAGILDDVYIKHNVLKARWVEESRFFYTKIFNLDFCADEKIYLTFDVLDYTAEIYLNDILVGKHNNVYYPCVLEVSSAAKIGKNMLTVVLESGLIEVSEKNISDYLFTNDNLDHYFHKRAWLRKPQSQFGWDWCERLVNIGIQGDVTLQIAKSCVVSQLQVVPQFNSYSECSYSVNAFICGEGIVDLEVNCNGETLKTTAYVKDNVISVHGKISNPKLWYPIGYGEQNMYEVTVKVSAGNELLYSKTKSTGFRKVNVNQTKHEQKGNYFILEVNDIKIFAKGSNLVPTDMIMVNMTNDRYDKLVQEALCANFNILRVWGGGVYESDYFYELCNKNGILVWQEFIFACINYPADNAEFLNNVKTEATYQVRRLSINPSLIVWCGNNEVNWLKEQTTTPKNDSDLFLYNQVLPQIITENDADKYYHFSSPSSPSGFNCADDFSGDQHPWNIGFENSDYRGYRKLECRFPNEGGINGSVSYATAKKCCPDEKVHSFDFVHHDNYIDLLDVNGHSACNFSVLDNIGKNVLEMPFRDYVYYSGLVQAEALKEYIDNFRSRKWDSASAIFWMFNDCWPTVRSWTVSDYYFNRTPSFYHVKRAFLPIQVIIRKENDKFLIFVINDTMKPFEYEIEFGFCGTNGEYIKKQTVHGKVDVNGKSIVGKLDYYDVQDYSEYFPYVFLKSNGKIIAQNRYFVEQLKNMKFKKSQLIYTDCGDYQTVSSNVFVLAACLDIDGENKFEDNMFDIFPNQPKQIDFKSKIICSFNAET